MIVTAQGRYFTAGIDLKASAVQRTREAEAKSTRPGWQYRKAYRDHHLLYDEFENLEKPIILAAQGNRSEEHTSELQSLMRISYAVFCLHKTRTKYQTEKIQNDNTSHDKAANT